MHIKLRAGELYRSSAGMCQSTQFLGVIVFSSALRIVCSLFTAATTSSCFGKIGFWQRPIFFCETYTRNNGSEPLGDMCSCISISEISGNYQSILKLNHEPWSDWIYASAAVLVNLLDDACSASGEHTYQDHKAISARNNNSFIVETQQNKRFTNLVTKAKFLDRCFLPSRRPLVPKHPSSNFTKHPAHFSQLSDGWSEHEKLRHRSGAQEHQPWIRVGSGHKLMPSACLRVSADFGGG